jgi:hypothetical protein
MSTSDPQTRLIETRSFKIDKRYFGFLKYIQKLPVMALVINTTLKF